MKQADVVCEVDEPALGEYFSTNAKDEGLPRNAWK